MCRQTSTSSRRSPPGRGVRAPRDGVTEALPEPNRDGAGGRNDALGSHPRFGQSKMQRVIASGGESPVHEDQIFDSGYFGGKNDLIVGQPVLFGQLGRT